MSREIESLRRQPERQEVNATHTPGPWWCNTLENPCETVHANRGCVAIVSHGTMNEISADECEANARLIAAAPELIDACELAYVELSKMSCECDCEDSPSRCPVCACRNAIEKATGREAVCT